MKIAFNTPERKEKLSIKNKKWIKENPELHKARMDKINKNPEKIKKMADAHRGMKRSDESKANISNGQKDAMEKDPEMKKRRSGTGMVYIHNPITKQTKRLSKEFDIPEGWIKGSGPKNKSSYKNLNKGSFFITNPITKQRKRLQKGEPILDGWVKGRL